MKLNHINLVVTDIPKAISLFVDHLGFKCIDNRKDLIAVLTNTDAFALVLWSSKLNKEQAVQYPENFHVGFYQPDRESVMAVYEKLQGQEVTFESEPRKLRNTFGFYFHFDRLMIEISVIPTSFD
ncbi:MULTISPECIES: VOC family protein [unclassified Siphonobacter]|uniref:VOC family protein n=1 Tax=unclassified Siphonobacter TaxID=2635712 RepID=UPI0027876D9F|nr:MULTISPECIES: VOC family protein [unclassified Siphonobacter]MDQ1090067.1 catechol 2,3-dioxygenase-like lactoylglutathione lyase family enzyme [Siphonobacter sp. SORGH_AS_1065]MDR6197517.1 catechol 2,3-dioxygenase-like lactoylglutathione lyase family enzyme [Siphonobacter sp. SORGH_AS_0500]